MKGRIKIGGIATLKAFQAGALAQYLARKFTLKEAQRQAEKHGRLLHKVTVRNLIVTSGYELHAGITAGQESPLWGIAIGTDATTPVIGDTALGTEVARNAWTYRAYAGAQVELSTLIVASDAAYHIYEAGVYGGNLASATPDSGTLFSHYLIEYDNSGGGADLTLDYLLTYQAE